MVLQNQIFFLLENSGFAKKFAEPLFCHPQNHFYGCRLKKADIFKSREQIKPMAYACPHYFENVPPVPTFALPVYNVCNLFCKY